MSKQIWAMEPNYLITYLEQVSNVSAEDIKAAADIFSNDTDHGIITFQNDTAIIEISGPLTMDGPSFVDKLFGYGGTGYADILDAITMVQAHPEVKNVTLKINSPGGEANGVDAVYTALMSLKKKCRITAENHGLCASAAYWIASASDEIVAMSPACETGSIGVVVSAYDYTKMLDKLGVKRYCIVSAYAPNKAPDIGTKDGRDIIQDRVDALERVFMSRVAAGRGITLDTVRSDYGRGGLFIAKDPDSSKMDSVKCGMIDRVENSLDDGFDFLNQGDDTGNISESNKNDQKSVNGGSTGMANTLEKLLAEDASAKALFDVKLKEQYDAGMIAGKTEIRAKVDKVLPYLAADSIYPAPIKTLACRVLKGDSDTAALEGAVTVFDMNEEHKKEKAATGENGKETGNNNQKPAADDGVISTVDEISVALKRINA